jgi:hypothetical protein
MSKGCRKVREQDGHFTSWGQGRRPSKGGPSLSKCLEVGSRSKSRGSKASMVPGTKVQAGQGEVRKEELQQAGRAGVQGEVACT